MLPRLPLLFVLAVAHCCCALQVPAQDKPLVLQFPPGNEPRNASWSPRGGHTITVVDDAMILSPHTGHISTEPHERGR